jgi:hypothetical protein
VPGQSIEIEPQVNLRPRRALHMNVERPAVTSSQRSRSARGRRRQRPRHPLRRGRDERAHGAVRELRGRALGILRHLQDAAQRPGTHAVILVDGLAPFVDTFWACALGGVDAVPLAPGNADEHKAKFFRVLARLPSPTLATERKVFDRFAPMPGQRPRAAFARLERRTRVPRRHRPTCRLPAWSIAPPATTSR